MDLQTYLLTCAERRLGGTGEEPAGRRHEAGRVDHDDYRALTIASPPITGSTNESEE